MLVVGSGTSLRGSSTPARQDDFADGVGSGIPQIHSCVSSIEVHRGTSHMVESGVVTPTHSLASRSLFTHDPLSERVILYPEIDSVQRSVGGEIERSVRFSANDGERLSGKGETSQMDCGNPTIDKLAKMRRATSIQRCDTLHPGNGFWMLKLRCEQRTIVDASNTITSERRDCKGR